MATVQDSCVLDVYVRHSKSGKLARPYVMIEMDRRTGFITGFQVSEEPIDIFVAVPLTGPRVKSLVERFMYMMNRQLRAENQPHNGPLPFERLVAAVTAYVERYEKHRAALLQQKDGR